MGEAGWQTATWAAGALALAALLTAAVRLLRAAPPAGQRQTRCHVGAWLVLIATVAGLLLADMAALPAWARACWAALAVPAAGWVALRGPALARAARPAPPSADDAAARLSDQDHLVQDLVVATYALQLGDHDRARAAVDGALRRSRGTLDRLLAEAGPGALSELPPRPPAT
ncbi:MAG: MFS transporter, partial [Frankia sp.]|nr:MFS transporter [Frankia sp.]